MSCFEWVDAPVLVVGLLGAVSGDDAGPIVDGEVGERPGLGFCAKVLVGLAMGDTVGEEVGLTVGRVDGDTVGEVVELVVGQADGPAVGDTVGEVVPVQATWRLFEVGSFLFGFRDLVLPVLMFGWADAVVEE